MNVPAQILERIPYQFRYNTRESFLLSFHPAQRVFTSISSGIDQMRSIQSSET
jgi:hypothetical protein